MIDRTAAHRPRPDSQGDLHPAHRRRAQGRPKDAPRPGLAAPHLAEVGDTRVAIVEAKGDPKDVAPQAVRRLLEAVEALRARRREEGKRDFEPGPVRARWPGADGAPLRERTGLFAVRVPDDVRDVPGARLERWPSARVAEALHEGTLATGPATDRRIRDFVEENGLRIAGPHEEVYLTPPDTHLRRTLIRYPVTDGTGPATD